ncbi:MAG: 16S rRNA (cytosine(967)-C(5))-methyltransferase RsmB [Ignavibacteriae bacterium]|nr:16S rRNA (cytosine(967)-C(5))-methyltransferase RsmB [Ignavibacteriota bacterium]
MEATEVQISQMLYAGPRGVAIKILNRVERTDSYLDKLLDSELKSDEIVDADKGLLAELVHGVLRWQGRLDWILNGFTHGNFAKAEINIKNALRVGLYQILFLTHVPQYAAVNETVEFIKRLRGEKVANFVNAVLRNIIRTIDGIHYPKIEEDPVQYLAVYYSHPQWMVKRWAARFEREELEKLLIANNEVPPLTLRINKLKITPSEFLSLLDKQNIQYQGSSFIDYFIKVRTLAGITHMNIFQSGYFSIQDESAALPVLLLAPQSGERVIDMCAAPGGKTTYIAELMKNEGEILAVDKYESKLHLIKMSCERLGIANVQFLVADSSHLETQLADKVIVDVPCSGLGVLRKKPDIKWKREPEDIQRLIKTQSTLLENAARLVKPGGVLVYSTCTMESEENDLMARSFLTEHPEFTLEDASTFVNKSVVTPEGYIETFPHRHHIDGSFAARMVRVSS